MKYTFVEEFGGTYALENNIRDYPTKTKNLQVELLRAFKPDGKFVRSLKTLKSIVSNLGSSDILQHEYPVVWYNIERNLPSDFFCGFKVSQDRVLHNKIAKELGLNVPKSVEISSYKDLQDFKYTKTFSSSKRGWYIKSTSHDVPTCPYDDSNVGMFVNSKFPLILQETIDTKFELTQQFMVANGHVCVLGVSTSIPKLFDDDSGPKVGDSTCLIKWDIDRQKILDSLPNLGKVTKKYGISGHFEIDYIVDSKGKLWFMEFLMGRFAISDSYGTLQGLACNYVDLVCKLQKRDIKPSEVKYKANYTLGTGIFTQMCYPGYLGNSLVVPVSNYEEEDTWYIPICSYKDKNNDIVGLPNMSRLFYIFSSGDDYKSLEKHNLVLASKIPVPYKIFRTNLSVFRKFVKYLESK